MSAPPGTPRDEERLARVREALAAESLDALLCTRPSNVLLLSGYWPVTGSAVAVMTREGTVAVAAPHDERAIAEGGWADALSTFDPGSLGSLTTRCPGACAAVRELSRAVGFTRARLVGHDTGAGFEPASYVSMFDYGERVHDLLAAAFPQATATDRSAVLSGLRARLTAHELREVRRACAVAREAFLAVAANAAAGLREVDIAGMLAGELIARSAGDHRSGGSAFCMSGGNGAAAASSFQRSSGRVVRRGDSVLLHANSTRGGFWTDITRTFTAGPPDPRQAAIAAAITEAGRAACAAIRPGVRGAEVDRAARAVMEHHGLGHGFRHGTGHGVGFAAIDHEAPPRLHPRSEDRLEPGMVMNVEPGYYVAHELGMRHCDMVVVTDDGAEVLTPFLAGAGERVLAAGDGALPATGA